MAEPCSDAVGNGLAMLMTLGHQRGYLTFAEISAAIPSHLVSAEKLEEILKPFPSMGIMLVDEAPPPSADLSIAGLPRKCGYKNLIYNEPARCLVAEIQQKLEGGPRLEELYWRPELSADYTKVPGSTEALHYSDAVSCVDGPVIFFNVVEWNDRGGDWLSLSSFDFSTGEVRTEVRREDIQNDQRERLWISSLVSATRNPGLVFCTIGFDPKSDRVDYVTKLVEYWLCKIQLKDFRITKITRLQNTFA